MASTDPRLNSSRSPNLQVDRTWKENTAKEIENILAPEKRRIFEDHTILLATVRNDVERGAIEQRFRDNMDGLNMRARTMFKERHDQEAAKLASSGRKQKQSDGRLPSTPVRPSPALHYLNSQPYVTTAVRSKFRPTLPRGAIPSTARTNWGEKRG